MIVTLKCLACSWVMALAVPWAALGVVYPHLATCPGPVSVSLSPATQAPPDPPMAAASEEEFWKRVERGRL